MSSHALVERATLQGDDLEALEAQVQRRLSGRVRGLRVLVRENGLILQGQAVTYHAKQLAQHAVMEQTHRPILANDIEVR
jgi:hypothetical protein